jgi:SAM-dependent methyltransferase
MPVDWQLTSDHRPGEEYVQYAEVYDALFGELTDDAEMYRRYATELGGPVLEIGSGTGRLAERLLRDGHAVTGVDASENMLAVAAEKLAPFGDRYQAHLADIREMNLGKRFRLAVAPYGMVAHLHSDDDRQRAFRSVFDHLEPGGVFIFDDMPGWLAGPSNPTALDVRRTGFDARTGARVRLMSTSVDVAGKPFTVRHDIIDWLQGDEVAKRIVVRVVFRNIPLADELRLLSEAGFREIDLFGDFDGRPFDRVDLTRNRRLVFRCRR